ncbi:hypothetical protein V6N13_091105 [Hibiscus sabdariffa]
MRHCIPLFDPSNIEVRTILVLSRLLRDWLATTMNSHAIGDTHDKYRSSPRPDWWKLNSSGSRNLLSGSSVCGEALRNEARR